MLVRKTRAAITTRLLYWKQEVQTGTRSVVTTDSWGDPRFPSALLMKDNCVKYYCSVYVSVYVWSVWGTRSQGGGQNNIHLDIIISIKVN